MSKLTGNRLKMKKKDSIQTHINFLSVLTKRAIDVNVQILPLSLPAVPQSFLR